MKTSFIHYWLVNSRGGEKVLENFGRIFPKADILTHTYDPGNIPEDLKKHEVKTTFIDNLPFADEYYQYYLPLMPWALYQLNLSNYDLIVSSESGPAKGVKTDDSQLHVCYCHSPMRYLWDMYDEYYGHAGLLEKLGMKFFFPLLRKWDKASAEEVDCFIANSHTVKERIERIYDRDAKVIYPPVNTKRFQISDTTEDFFLYVGELTHYKRPDLAVKAFNKLDDPLFVVGKGGMENELRKIAEDNITFMGRVSDRKLMRYYSQCRALIFPGLEDFGIVPVEAMASGRPVLAYGEGGAVETVIDEVTGLLFEEQTVNSLLNTLSKFKDFENSFQPIKLRKHAKKFSSPRFSNQIKNFIQRKLRGKNISIDTNRLH